VREHFQARNASPRIIVKKGDSAVAGAKSPQELLVHAIWFDEETDHYKDIIAISREAPLG
jgi:hypothetical protein